VAAIAIEKKLQPITNWAALAGHWTFEKARATYTKPTTQSSTPFGLAISDARLRDGTVSAQVTLGRDGETTAGIVLGYSGEQGYVAGQLGAYNAAYAISEFLPAVGWRGIAVAGAITNLDRARNYNLEDTVQGQRVTLVVDNVQVIEHLIPSPLAGDQVGLYAWGANEVQFGNVAYERRQPMAFVAMPFSDPYDTVYREVIRAVALEEGLDVVRVDEVTGPGIIFEDIKQQIENASIVIAEISAPNQNVYYELGYAHALNKPTILLARRSQELLPFDIRSYRVIFYDDSIGGKPAVERELRKHLRTVLRNIIG
jgi:hypothetical protein